MKKLILVSILISLLAFACTDNPLFKISLNIPYTGSYTISAADQVGNQLIISSNADSYSTFIANVNQELSDNGIEGNFEANVTFLELTIAEEADVDWSVLGEVGIDLTIEGEPSNMLDAVSFPATEGKVLTLNLPKGGVSVNEFLSYEEVALHITANLSTSLIEDIPVAISAKVAVSSREEE